MKLGIIAGNRFFPVMLAEAIKRKDKAIEIVAFCFRGETSAQIVRHVDRAYWIEIGKLRQLREALEEEHISECIMAGQITPVRIFKRNNWDRELTTLIEKTGDMRPHTVFSSIICHLEHAGVRFLDSTLYLKEMLAQDGPMNAVAISDAGQADIDFGVTMISRFVDLDIGQTMVIKDKSVVALESLEGTDRTILRGCRLAGRGGTVLKFSKVNQDLRFDVPVVGLSTLVLLHKIRAATLVLEASKVIILEKEKFLLCAKRWGISVVGAKKRR
ncbi:MAG: UDP-2,3-diacylglucosamine diphosphatase LpxI [Candidatus Omnitrophota bacterium]